jgi:hypothetical protein
MTVPCSKKITSLYSLNLKLRQNNSYGAKRVIKIIFPDWLNILITVMYIAWYEYQGIMVNEN